MIEISSSKSHTLATTLVLGQPPSLLIAELLSDADFCFQRSAIGPLLPAVNSLLIASRWSVRIGKVERAPDNKHRWLHVNVVAPNSLAVVADHIPNRVTGAKYPFMDAVVDVVRHWRGPPAVLMGDANSGQIDIDEGSSAFIKIEDRWIATLGALNWQDAFRLDQMFLHPYIGARVVRFDHHWFGTTPERKGSAK